MRKPLSDVIKGATPTVDEKTVTARAVQTMTTASHLPNDHAPGMRVEYQAQTDVTTNVAGPTTAMTLPTLPVEQVAMTLPTLPVEQVTVHPTQASHITRVRHATLVCSLRSNPHS